MARILIVEDDRCVQTIICRLIATLPTPHEVMVADDVYTALELVKATPPDLVILDLMLRKATTGQGFMVYLQQVRRTKGLGEIPVIVSSAQPRETLDGLRGCYPSVQEALQKPWDVLAMRETLLRLLPSPPMETDPGRPVSLLGRGHSPTPCGVTELRPQAFDNPAILRCLAG